MNILVLGAGAIGSAFGGFLSPHHEVTLLGREPHMRAIRRQGLQVSGIWGRHRFRRFYLESKADRLIKRKPPFDLILVTVKSYDTPRVAKWIKRLVGPQTVVMSLQNGLGNIEALHRFLPSHQVLAGRVIFGVTVPKPGSICVTVIAHPTAIGETSVQKITPRVEQMVRIFQEASLPTVTCRDIRQFIWAKVVYNSTLNPLASLLECHYGLLGEYQATRQIMNEVVEEIYRVAGEIKIDLQPRSPKGYQKLFYSQLLPRTYNHRPSMLQDLEKGRRTEIDALNGAIVRLGRKCKVKVPVNSLLTRMIKQKENQ